MLERKNKMAIRNGRGTFPFGVKRYLNGTLHGEENAESLDQSKKSAAWALKNQNINQVVIENRDTGVQRLVTLKNGKIEIKKITGLPRSAW